MIPPREFAITRHGDQKYGEAPYAVHLDDVAVLVQPYGPTAVTVAYLHDVIEDSPTTLSEVRDAYGVLVADCVDLLTDPPGVNRRERKMALFARLKEVRGVTELALVVKVADRLANLQACIEGKNLSLLQMYLNEHAAFQEAVFRPGLCDDLWGRISALQSARR